MKKHKFQSTDIELHDDGSATIHHKHVDGPHKDVKHAAGNLDEVHDCLEDHLNPEEIEKKVSDMGQDPEDLEEQIHPGIHQEVMQAAQDNASPSVVIEASMPADMADKFAEAIGGR